ncbi:MAG TPA: GIY-YIG nuclease family protein [Dehalococcoidia bacterium]|nr:GIY-YIG nuclease family protein [Dehalococcoidia bacterium]
MGRREEKIYYAYILTNRSGTLYTGVTGDLVRRMEQHKLGSVPGFASTYKLDRLVYFEETTDLFSALERERQIKAWRREKRIALINGMNPRTW